MKPRYTRPIADGIQSPEIIRRAGNARAAIDGQSGNREHVHRSLVPNRQAVPMAHTSPEVRYDIAKKALVEALTNRAELQHKVSEARRCAAATGHYMPPAQFSALQNDLQYWVTRVHDLQGQCGSLKREIARREQPFECRFMDIARLILPPHVFDEIKALAAKPWLVSNAVEDDR